MPNVVARVSDGTSSPARVYVGAAPLQELASQIASSPPTAQSYRLGYRANWRYNKRQHGK
jgi:hypothetical protein